jgi:aldose 1-epimerase
MKRSFYFFLMAIWLISFSCNKRNSRSQTENISSLVKKENFISTIRGKETKLFTLENENGIVLKLCNYGARIVQVIAPDGKGNFDDITLGWGSIEEYLSNGMFQGCIVGRYANRIARGRIELNGKIYQLSINNEPNTLHGGPNGIHSVVWDAEETEDGVLFSYTSPDLEEGYPGEVKFKVLYSLNNNNEISIKYKATTNDSTYINLTNHAYWNLLGEAKGSILNHELMINAKFITPVDETLIPTGDLMKVDGTPFDFKTFHTIGERINNENEQLKFGKGYDHNFVLNKTKLSKEPELAATVIEPQTGRKLEILTTEPALQFYSGNFMNGKIIGKNGHTYMPRYAFAVECQHYPDSPNHKNFPSTLLLPGKEYYQLTIYRFSVVK